MQMNGWRAMRYQKLEKTLISEPVSFIILDLWSIELYVDTDTDCDQTKTFSAVNCLHSCHLESTFSTNISTAHLD